MATLQGHVAVCVRRLDPPTAADVRACAAAAASAGAAHVVLLPAADAEAAAPYALPFFSRCVLASLAAASWMADADGSGVTMSAFTPLDPAAARSTAECVEDIRHAAEADGARVAVIECAAATAADDDSADAASAPAPLPRYVQSAVRRYGLYGCAPPRGRRARPAVLGAFDGWRSPVRLQADAAAAAADDAAEAAATSGGGGGGGGGAALPAPPAAASPPAYSVALVGGSFSPPTVAHGQVAAAVAVAVAAGGEAGADGNAAASVADEVWVVPCGARPDKPSLDVPAAHRHVMAVLAVEAADPLPPPEAMEGEEDARHRRHRRAPIHVAPLELWAPAALPSYVLMRSLQQQAAAAAATVESRAAAEPTAVEFQLVIGADLLADLPRWRYPAALLARVPFLLVPRPGFDDGSDGSGGATMPTPAPRRLTRLAAPGGGRITTAAVSSSEVRAALAEVDGDGSGDGTRRNSSSSWSLDGVRAACAGRLAPPVAAYVWAHRLYRRTRRSRSPGEPQRQ